jgi:SMC interacting uncharacterized protein involved in chromosome segregation
VDALTDAIQKTAAALKAITSSTLTAQQLGSSLRIMKATDIHALIDEFNASLPAEPEDEHEKEAYKKAMQQIADELNKKIDPLKDALEEVKKLRSTLNLTALDEIIKVAQKIIRPLYNVTAAMQ